MNYVAACFARSKYIIFLSLLIILGLFSFTTVGVFSAFASTIVMLNNPILVSKKGKFVFLTGYVYVYLF